jgi:hypothetical protein
MSPLDLRDIDLRLRTIGATTASDVVALLAALRETRAALKQLHSQFVTDVGWPKLMVNVGGHWDSGATDDETRDAIERAAAALASVTDGVATVPGPQ